MYKVVAATCLILVSHFINAISSETLINAATYYSTNNMKELRNVYNNHLNDPTIAYLYAKINLNHDNPVFSENYVNKFSNSYKKNDLLHQLLTYYYNTNSYSKFKWAYNALNNTKISENETCGYDVSNIELHSNLKTKTNPNWLINSSITPWCAQLGLLFNKQKIITNSQFNQLLVNLITSGDIFIFNQIVKNKPELKPINFLKYKNYSFNKLPADRYLIIYFISQKARKSPDCAVGLLNNHSLDKQDQLILANYIAVQFAKQQQFNSAIKLFEKYYSNDLNSDTLEWRVRSYLALGNWNKLIIGITDMPNTIQKKDVWLYWLAKSYNSLKQYNKSTYFLRQIPKSYSYYYLLAQGELAQPIVFDTKTPANLKIEDKNFLDRTNSSLYLYQLGKYSNSVLFTIGTFEWYYLTRIATPSQLIAMSIKSHNQGYYDLSINAANRLDKRILYLSFPLLYLNYYKKYSELVGISSNLSLAITRQESRFNPFVLALDKGMGLMQIMPDTAKYIARKSKYSKCSMLNAECNIKYGTWYLGNLYNKFGSYIYAAAGYNCGPNRAKKWQENLRGLDNQIQIELIPIQTTREYVQKTLTNKAIYDMKLNGLNKLDMLEYVTSLKENEHNPNNLGDDNTDTRMF